MFLQFFVQRFGGAWDELPYSEFDIQAVQWPCVIEVSTDPYIRRELRQIRIAQRGEIVFDGTRQDLMLHVATTSDFNDLMSFIRHQPDFHKILTWDEIREIEELAVR